MTIQTRYSIHLWEKGYATIQDRASGLRGFYTFTGVYLYGALQLPLAVARRLLAQ
jgi:hypothetical protein